MAAANRLVKEAEEGFPKMCFRMSDAHEFKWYIVDDEKTVRKKRGLVQILKRSLPPTPKPCFYSACTAIDNTIYVLGGAKAAYTFVPSRGPKFGDVYFIHIDTDDHTGGDADDDDSKIDNKKWNEWRRGRPLHGVRQSPYALNFNGKLLVMSGFFKTRNARVVKPFAEMWDADKKCWEKLYATVPPRFSPMIDGHAVLDNGRILFHERYNPALFCYDVEAGNVQIYREDFGQHECSAFVDGILYTLTDSFSCPAGLIGFDAYNPESPKYRVSLSIPQPDDGQYYEWLPEKDKVMCATPSFTMVALGNHCLAVLWEEFIENGVEIYCSRWKMSKKKKGRRLKLAGRPISFTTYRIYDYVYLENCLVLGPTVATNGHAKKKLDDKPAAEKTQVDMPEEDNEKYL